MFRAHCRLLLGEGSKTLSHVVRTLPQLAAQGHSWQDPIGRWESAWHSMGQASGKKTTRDYGPPGEEQHDTPLPYHPPASSSGLHDHLVTLHALSFKDNTERWFS